jgi:muramidase (phage lysozyme)
MTVVYKDNDKCTDMILDFIAGGVPGNPSGESLGNYNAVIGNARSQNDLATLTINEIYALMGQLRAAGRPSSAVGRYQIIRNTLQTLQSRLNIAGSEKFTPQLQDRLALALLVGRGYQKWWTGAITDERFAHNISLEWASLPDPDNGGKSHYDGVGPNHASTSLDVVLAMLARARAAKPQAGAMAGLTTAAGQTAAAVVPGEAGHLSEATMEKSPLEWIKDIQRILQSAGYYQGDIDGIFGQGSDEALDDLLDAARH